MKRRVNSVYRDSSSWSSGRGFSLAEVLVGMMIFAFLSLGISVSMIKQRKDSENAMCQTLAQATAGGIIEQVRRTGFTTLSDFTAAAATAPTDYPYTTTDGEKDSGSNLNYRSLTVMFIGQTSDNFAEVQEFNLYWANVASPQLYSTGARVDRTDNTSTILGVLVDVDHRDSSGNVIHSRRYMPMQVSITRALNANKDAVEVTLRYRWAKPDVLSGATPTYYSTRSLRTVISKIPTY